MIKQIQWFFVCMVVLSACTTLPKSADQWLYTVPNTYISIKYISADLLDKKLISKEKAESINKKLNEIRPTIELAVDLMGKKEPLPDDLIQSLTFAQRILMEIQIELQKKVDAP